MDCVASIDIQELQRRIATQRDARDSDRNKQIKNVFEMILTKDCERMLQDSLDRNGNRFYLSLEMMYERFYSGRMSREMCCDDPFLRQLASETQSRLWEKNKTAYCMLRMNPYSPCLVLEVGWN